MRNEAPVWKKDLVKYAQELGGFLMATKIGIISISDELSVDPEIQKKLNDEVEDINYVENELKAWPVLASLAGLEVELPESIVERQRTVSYDQLLESVTRLVEHGYCTIYGKDIGRGLITEKGRKFCDHVAKGVVDLLNDLSQPETADIGVESEE